MSLGVQAFALGTSPLSMPQRAGENARSRPRAPHLRRQPMKSRTFLRAAALLALAPALMTTPVHAQQAFPNKPVRLVVPQTPGGASDALARIVAQKLS